MPNLEILAQHNRERLAKAKEQYLGKTFSSNNFGDFIVIDYVNNKDITVEFIATGYRTKTTTKEINQGKIADRLKPSVFGVGVIGTKYPTTINRKSTKHYVLWKSMLERCFGNNNHKPSVSYKSCSVNDNFKYYTYFYEWCNEQIGFNDGFNLDKDLLVKGNKVYSEDSCVFLPQEINSLLVKRTASRGEHLIGVHWCKTHKAFVAQVRKNKGKQEHLGYFNTELEAFNAYKVAKESFIKEQANKWQSQIDPRAYNALMKYAVGITD